MEKIGKVAERLARIVSRSEEPRKEPTNPWISGSFLPTLVVLVLLFAGIYFIWAGVYSPSRIEIGDMTINTSSAGLALVFLAAVLLIVLAYLESRRGRSLSDFVEMPPE
jgi:hypothetical protein